MRHDDWEPSPWIAVPLLVILAWITLVLLCGL